MSSQPSPATSVIAVADRTSWKGALLSLQSALQRLDFAAVNAALTAPVYSPQRLSFLQAQVPQLADRPALAARLRFGEPTLTREAPGRVRVSLVFFVPQRKLVRELGQTPDASALRFVTDLEIRQGADGWRVDSLDALYLVGQVQGGLELPSYR
jgi:hypothetical protein